MAAPADATPQLMELGETKPLSVCHNHDGRIGHIHPDFNDRTRNKRRKLAALEGRHHPVPLGGGFRVTLTGLRAISERLAGLGLPTVIVQEGGYLVDRLGEYAVTFLQPFEDM